MNTHRQKELMPDRKASEASVIIVGAGATGSFIALALAKIGIGDITVYDDDTVEDHNIPNQFYRLSDIGKPKVLALQEIIKSFTGIEITAVESRVTTSTPMSGIVIFCVDEISIREELFHSSIRYGMKVNYFIDTRMLALDGQIYHCDPKTREGIRFYESHLFPQDEQAVGRCTARSIMFTVLGIASLTSSIVRSRLLGLEMPPKMTAINFETLQIIQA